MISVRILGCPTTTAHPRGSDPGIHRHCRRAGECQRTAPHEQDLPTSCPGAKEPGNVRDFEFGTDAQLCTLLLGNLDRAKDALEVS